MMHDFFNFSFFEVILWSSVSLCLGPTAAERSVSPAVGLMYVETLVEGCFDSAHWKSDFKRLSLRAA